MRVLHLPSNIASYPAHTVRGLRQIGVNAFGLVFSNTPVQSAAGLKVIQTEPPLKPHGRTLVESLRPVKLYNYAKWSYYYVKWSAWADVVHWYFGTRVLPWGLDLKYLKALDKPRVVEWLGSDIRIPEIEFLDNPYYRAAFRSGHRIESMQRSRQVQKQFAKAGFATIVPACMLRYVQRDICRRVYVVPQRIVLSDYRPAYPNPETARPVIVHSATDPIIKGTPAVLRAIEQLKTKYNFKFHLIHGIPRNEALQLVQRADIFLDQFVMGDHGMAALEAMAYGKPVLCYIKPSMVDQYPRDCPIINANQDDLAEALKPFLIDGELRHEMGKRSRAYVEKYHDAAKLALQLVSIYHGLIEHRTRDRC